MPCKTYLSQQVLLIDTGDHEDILGTEHEFDSSALFLYRRGFKSASVLGVLGQCRENVVCLVNLV